MEILPWYIIWKECGSEGQKLITSFTANQYLDIDVENSNSNNNNIYYTSTCQAMQEAFYIALVNLEL